ncbi:MAG: DUF4276 family protein [Lachnospiraceae bacterium]|nr:DUF4276 family protein [Lachnospiraceae bacterium]
MSKCLVLFVEGETEIEFYKAVVAHARNIHPNKRFDTNIEYKNVKGVGGFKSNALRKFVKEVKPKYGEDTIYTVMLCSDTDVFEFSSKPPIKWDEIEQALLDNGAKKVFHIKARRSIEDWFLYDADGIIKFLHLPKNTKVTGKSGYDKLQNLYKRASKVYYKGIRSNGMIEKLDINKIVGSVKDQLKPLYKELGIKFVISY